MTYAVPAPVTPRPNGRGASNRMILRRLGLTVATLAVMIRNVD